MQILRLPTGSGGGVRGLGCSGEGGGEGAWMEVVGLKPGAGKRRRFPQRALALTTSAWAFCHTAPPAAPPKNDQT